MEAQKGSRLPLRSHNQDSEPGFRYRSLSLQNGDLLIMAPSATCHVFMFLSLQQKANFRQTHGIMPEMSLLNVFCRIYPRCEKRGPPEADQAPCQCTEAPDRAHTDATFPFSAGAAGT